MKTVWKKLLAALLCIAMLAACACGSGGAADTESEQEDEVVVSVVSVKRDIDYGEKQEALSFEGSEAAESELYVAPVEGITDDFIRGVDISSYIVEKDSGVTYYDFDGNELSDSEFFRFLAECGVNWVRVRVWNDPYDSEGNGYGGGNNDIDKAVAIGKLATNAGMKVLIDFHYSDFWADPSKQFAPKAWADMDLEEKEEALGAYTTECMKKLLDEGVDVGMVQVGNETNTGMAGETVGNDGSNVYALIAAGCDAVRSVAAEYGADIKIAVHYTNAESTDFAKIAGELEDAGVDYDVFGASYYTFWHGTLENLTEKLSQVAQEYGKEVMVAETSYLYTNEDGDGSGNSVTGDSSGVTISYEISEQGQVNAVRDVIQAVADVGDAGLGVFYWEPAWIPVNICGSSLNDMVNVLPLNQEAWENDGSGWASSYAGEYDPDDAGLYYGGSSWDNQALFAFDGTPLESLNVFRYIFSGTTAAFTIASVPDMECELGIGEAVILPETASAVMIDGSTMEIPVTWDEEQRAAAEAAGAGDYEIEGTAECDGVAYPLICSLHILRVNYIQNDSFEDADMSMWVITGNAVDRVADNNMRTGDYSLKFWSEDAVSFTVEQTIEGLAAGTYELSAYLQGGDAGSDPVFELYITVNGEEYKAESGVTSWQNWDNPVVSGVEIPEGATVVVGVRVDAAAGAWGAWDDFTLYKME